MTSACRLQRRQVDQPVQKPVYAQHPIGVHLSYLFPAQKYKGDETKADGHVRNDGKEHGIEAGFQRRVVFNLKAEKQGIYYG